jgi:hypothetical protein
MSVNKIGHREIIQKLGQERFAVSENVLHEAVLGLVITGQLNLVRSRQDSLRTQGKVAKGK